MKKILLVILVVVLAAPAVGFKDDDKTKVIPRMPGGGGYCQQGRSECDTYPDPQTGRPKHYPCVELGVLPPNITEVEWSQYGGECGKLKIWFDGGDYTEINCHCSMWT